MVPKAKCIIILSEKSSGSSALQSLLAKFARVQHVEHTRHFENETLYWTKSASLLGRPQVKMVDSEVPLDYSTAKKDLVALLKDNLNSYPAHLEERELVMEGWRLLCEKYAPIFLEKSPHHLCQWSALELIGECIRESTNIEFLLIGLVRNPMDTIYSQYMRWKSSPDKVEKQWILAYRNLRKLENTMGQNVVIVRYEDMVHSLEHLKPVFDFCGVEADNGDNSYLHSKSLQKWRNDRLFGFSLSEEAVKLAESYGYVTEELTNDTYLLWPVVNKLSRPAFELKKRSKGFLQKSMGLAFSALAGKSHNKGDSP